MFESLWLALALLLVLEGILPFANPKRFRESLQTIANMSDQHLRWIGLASMLVGLGILAWIN